MDQERKTETGPESVFANWMKMATDFWEDIAKVQASMTAPSGASEKPRKGGTTHQFQRTWETSGKVFQSLMSALSNPESMESMLKGMDSVPEFLTAMLRQSWEGYGELQKQWMERASKIGQETKAYNFEDIDQDTFRAIRELYEKEFQKFLYIPPVGLTRFYQERFNIMLDKHTLFQTALQEFLYMFYVPIEKTSAVMQQKMEEMADKGEFYENFKDYYNIWIRILEGHYMTLLKSPEYTQVMDNTIQSLVQYKDARNEFLCDLLQKLPIPTNREMDELYKDFHVLKRQVRELSGKLDELLKNSTSEV